MRGSEKVLSVVALLFALLALGVPAAVASKGTIAVIPSAATGLAVNDTTGNLYAFQADGTVGVFDADGAPLFEFGGGFGPEPGQFATTAGIAVNQATGHVYVLDMQFNYRIQEFEADGDFVRMWGVDVNATNPSTEFEICTAASGDTCQAGQSSTEPGGFSAEGVSALMYIAVDPATGNVIAPDAGNHRVQVFSSTGELIRVLGSATEHFTANDTPASVAADSGGRVFALGAGSGGSAVAGPVYRFGPDGAYLGSFDLGSRLHMAIDSTTDRLYFTQRNDEGDWRIGEYDQDGQSLEEHAIGIPRPNGLALNSASGRIYASDEAGGRILVIDDVPVVPQATMVAVTDVAGESATFEGTVDPQGTAYDTRWRFVCTPACPGLSGGNAGNGSGAVAVSEEAAGLDPNTEYEVRLVATREFGSGRMVSAPLSFTTGRVTPTSSLQEASRLTDTSARLGALIDARNSATTFYFEYGTDSGYGNFAPVGKAAGAGDELGEIARFQTVTGLQPETTYHFRLVAQSAGGTFVGDDHSFTTRSTAEAAVPKRGIELVNTPDKSNQNAYGYLTPDGKGVVWSVYTGGPGAPIGQGAAFLATRSAGGWASRSLVPPASEQVGENGELPYTLTGATDDYSEVLFQIGLPPRDGGLEPEVTLARVGPAIGQEVIHTIPPNTDLWPSSNTVADGLEHLFMLTAERLDPSHPEGVRQVYDVATDPPTLISRMPGTGEAAQCGLEGNEYANDFGGNRRWNSVDGTYVFFEARGDGDCAGVKNLYMHDTKGTAAAGDDETVLVSGPPVAGSDQGARLLEAALDGPEAVYYSASQLTADDENESNDVYRWSRTGGNECLTCVVPDAAVAASESHHRQVHVSEDLSRVYFTSQKALVPGEGEDGAQNLYVVRDGELKYISASSSLGYPTIGEMTPDGSVLVFRTTERITVDDNGGALHFYRYDDRDGSIECMTCPLPGTDPIAPRGEGAEGGLGLAITPPQMRNYQLTADGRTFVFDTVAKLVPRDVNGDADIYQWHNGTISLITDGVTEYNRSVGETGRLALLGVSRDGTNVLFRTAVKQTGHVKDKLVNVYTARIGGGFPDPEPPTEACLEDACQGPLIPAPPLSSSATESLRGAGNVRDAAPKRRCAKRKVRRGKRCVAKGAKKKTAKKPAKRSAGAKQGRNK